METELQTLKDLSAPHGELGSDLFNACKAEVFPCDALAFTVLERSLNLLKGFRVLLENGGYTCGVGLLRLQLDNVLRFNGVAMAEDPHGVAFSIFTGTELRKIKDRTGQLMNDKRLVELLSDQNPWIEHVYKLGSAYIHLSKQHFEHFLHRSAKNEERRRNARLHNWG